MSNGKGRTAAQWAEHNKAAEKADADAMAKARDVANLIGPPGRLKPTWRPHDLRRTCATGMAEIGVLVAPRPALQASTTELLTDKKRGSRSISGQRTCMVRS